MSTATPYLCAHDATAAIDFYASAFGAEVSDRYDDEGRIGHVTLTIGSATVYLSDEYPQYGAISPRTLGGATASVVLTVDDPDSVYARAVSAGAEPQRPVAGDPGERSGWLTDPFGHRWNIRSEPAGTAGG